MMKKANIVLNVEPLQGFKLLITFKENNEKRIYDLKQSPFWGFGDFIKLQEQEEFTKVKPAFNTIEWECGLDISPEELYSESVPV